MFVMTGLFITNHIIKTDYEHGESTVKGWGWGIKSTHLLKLPSPSQPAKGSDFEHQNTSIYFSFLLVVQIFTPASQHWVTHAYNLTETQSTASHSCLNPTALVFDMMKGRRRSSTTRGARGESRLWALLSLQPFRQIKNQLMHIVC